MDKHGQMADLQRAHLHGGIGIEACQTHGFSWGVWLLMQALRLLCRNWVQQVDALP